MIFEVIIGVVFGTSFSVYCVYNKYRFLYYVSDVLTYVGLSFGFSCGLIVVTM